MKFLLTAAFAAFLLASCSVSKKLERSAEETVLNSEALTTAHVGISVYEPATGKYWYNYQGDKYFVPASNTKIPTCYAAMKYLGDSLVGLRYATPDEGLYKNTLVVIKPTGDPTFLHNDFERQNGFSLLKQMSDKEFSLAIVGAFDSIWREQPWGNGWSWNDYDASYMAERSSFPVFGNVVNIELLDPSKRIFSSREQRLFRTRPAFFDSVVNQNIRYSDNLFSSNPKVAIKRRLNENAFMVGTSEESFRNHGVPFVTNDMRAARKILEDILKKRINDVWHDKENRYGYDCEGCDLAFINISKWHTLHSQPTDSLLRPMMHRSDNFFAEQSLLMVSNERLGYMSDEKIIDTLLKTDFKDLPQKPRWADGSGLSRYNLFTPQDFVFILNKMRNEFGMARIKDILPTGGEGTLSSYYKTDSTFLYAKTGTLSGVVALSGFLTTKGGKDLIFSVLVNNHQGSATAVRRAVETFIHRLRERN